MAYKTRLWIASIAIVLVCWVDHQLLSEGLAARMLSPITRQLGHLIVLILTTIIGYWGWKKHPYSWTKKFWLFIYTVFTLFLLLIGLINWKWQILGKELLDIVSNTRYAFCSPLPFLMIYVLTKINKAE